MFTDLDLIAIAQWAIPWRVAASLRSGTPARPDLEGSTCLRTALLTGELRDLLPEHTWYEADHHVITLYDGWDPTGRRTTAHQTHWSTVQHWLDTWTTHDRATLLDLDTRRAHLWMHDDEQPEPWATTATHTAARGRREERLYGRAGEIHLYRAACDAMTALTRKHLMQHQAALF